MKISTTVLLFVLVFLSLTSCDPEVSKTGERTHFLVADSIINNYTAKAVLLETEAKSKSTLIQPYKKAIQGALKSAPFVLNRLTNISEEQSRAIQIALKDKRILEHVRDKKTQAPIRTEVFGVYPLRQTDVKPEFINLYQQGGTFRVNIYNFQHNFTLSLFVSVPKGQVFDLMIFPFSAPEIPAHLKEIAIDIASNAPEVQAALGYKPGASQALMADTKTSLNRSRCERLRHLCVAPTFVRNEEDKALWAIVDLKDLRLIGIRWTDVSGENAGQFSTQRNLEYDAISDCYCKDNLRIKKNNWELNYMITNSDGLQISDVKYKDQEVLESAKLVDWHVSYSQTEGFGYSDAVGCPTFSSATVLAVEKPVMEEIKDENGAVNGFRISQKFSSEGWPLPCNYNYEQRYEFYGDGRIRVATASLGRGCGNDGTYRPVFRIAFPDPDNSFYQWSDNNNWKEWEQEGYDLQTATSKYDTNGYLYKIQNKAGAGFFIEPCTGQFGDGGRGDNAYTYLTLEHPQKAEGYTDLPTIGPCCNTDHRQGPEKFIDNPPENTSQKKLVVWYVPQMKNDNAEGNEYCWAKTYWEDGALALKSFPCFAGPMLVPIPR